MRSQSPPAFLLNGAGLAARSALGGPGVSALLALGVALGAAPPARAGGPRQIDPKFEAEQARADATAERWRVAGVAAMPEMVAAICHSDELLRPHAAGVLENIGRPALAPLVEAAATWGECDLTSTLAEVFCHASAGQTQLAAMLADARPRVVWAARGAIHHIVDTSYGHTCRARADLVAGALPGLRALARTGSGKELEDTLWTIERIGPEAAPLVPELVAALDQEDVAGNYAAGAIEAIGPAAAAAVPKLTTLLRGGGKWRYRAVQALGGIGPAAAPALRDFRPGLLAAAPRVCQTPGRYSESDVIVESVLSAAARIGGAGVEPLVPDLVKVFPRMRACGLAREDWWLQWLGKLGAHGAAASELLLAMAEDPDELLPVRQQSLAALDAIGPRFTWWWRLRRLRKAFRRKEEIFARHDSPDQRGQLQILLPPPPPPKVPPEVVLCRTEAGLPAAPAMPEPPVAPPGNEAFAACVRKRLCGPDEETYRATMAACCRGYGAPPWPWFCATSAPPAR